ncbi:MAG TPA: hypothetical protein VGW35_19430 [Methylomirabilota bacterium]|nr:hypothetical protein [Methylomirabilota bacterium]
MRLWRAFIGSPKGRVLVAAVACYCAWQGYLTLRAPGKIAPSLRRAGDRAVDVTVTLPFPPERFHVLVFQRFGRVAGTNEHQVELRGVRPSDLRGVARPYWVTRVEPLSREPGR